MKLFISLSIVIGTLVLSGCGTAPTTKTWKQTYSSFDLPSEHPAKELGRDFTCDLKNSQLDMVLRLYQKLSGRTVIAGQVSAIGINLLIETPVNRIEALQMFDTVLAQHHITMVLSGDKAVIAVPTSGAINEAAPEITLPWQLLPQSSSYMKRTVRLQHLRPSETLPVLMVHAKLPNGIIPVDSEQLLLLRDYAANIRQQLKLLEELEQKYSSGK